MNSFISSDWSFIKKLLIGSVFVVQSLSLSSQTYFDEVYDFEKGSDIGFAVCQTGSNFFIAAGGRSRSSYENRKYLLTNENGVKITNRAYNYSELVRGGALLKLSDSVFIDARTIQITDPFLRSWIELQAINLNGDSLWRKSYKESSGLEYTIPTLIKTSDTSFILSGKVTNSSTNSDPMYMHINNDGDEIWRKKITSTSFAEFYSGASNKDGSFYLAGRKDTLGKNHPWVVAFNSTGNIIWSKLFPQGYYSVNGITVLKDGNIIVTDDSLVVANQPNSETFKQIYKIDSLGNLIWRRVHPDTFRTTSRYDKCIEGNDSTLYIMSRIGNGLPAYTLTRLTPEGFPIWMHRYYYFGSYLWDFIRTSDGGFLFVGDRHPDGGGGTQDIWLLKTDSNGCLTKDCETEVYNYPYMVKEPTKKENQFRVYPNPTNGAFTIAYNATAFSENGSATLEITNLQGQQVYKQFLQRNNGKETIVLGEKNTGVYLLSIKNKNELIYQQRLVIY